MPVAPTGWLYAVAALVLGAAFLREAHQLLRVSTAVGAAGPAGPDGSPADTAGTGRPPKELAAASMRLFHVSISYLTLLFVAIALDPFVRF